MAASGAQVGNKNAFKGTEWSKSLKRAMARVSAQAGDESVSWRRGLDRVADKVVEAAGEGQKDAWQEIANRIEGRPGQSILLATDPDNPLRVSGTVRYIDSSTKD